MIAKGITGCALHQNNPWNRNCCSDPAFVGFEAWNTAATINDAGAEEIGLPTKPFGWTIMIGHTYQNYPIPPPLPFAMLLPSLAFLVLRRGLLGSARQRPRLPLSSELPSRLLSLRISLDAYSGVFLSERLGCAAVSEILDHLCGGGNRPRARVGGIGVEAPCFSRGELDFSPAESALQFKWAFAICASRPHGRGDVGNFRSDDMCRSKPIAKAHDLRRDFFRSAE